MKSISTNIKLLTNVVKNWQKTSTRCFFKKKGEKEKKETNIIHKEPIFDGSVDDFGKGIYSVDNCDEEAAYPAPRVVIVGAGMAGIAAAARLSEHGIHNYVLLESHDRMGGRIHSMWVGDVVAELGAQGKMDGPGSLNPVFGLTAGEKPPQPGTPACTHTRGLFERATSGAMQFPPTFVAYNKFRQIVEEANSIYCLGGSKQHGSMLNFISLRIQQELHDFPEEHQHDAARVMFGLSHMMTARSGFDTNLIAHDATGYYMSIPGGEVRVPLGLMGVLAPMMRQIQGTIRVCKTVNTIYWGTCKKSGHRAIVVCEDGEEFPADYVILTVSLGVLCHFCDKLFCPALSSAKMDAIRRLGFGYCNKIFLNYCQPFWAWQKCNLNFKFYGTELSTRCDWTRGVQATEIVPNSKHVLCMWVVGPSAAEMEGMCDKDVAESATCLLRAMTGHCIPYPSCILRSQWVSDHRFLGSYSCDYDCSPGCAQEAIAQPLPSANDPVPPILLFAGEHTCPGHSATVSGARISGIREADRILQLTKEFEGPPLHYEAIPLNQKRAKVCKRKKKQKA